MMSSLSRTHSKIARAAVAFLALATVAILVPVADAAPNRGADKGAKQAQPKHTAARATTAVLPDEAETALAKLDAPAPTKDKWRVLARELSAKPKTKRGVFDTSERAAQAAHPQANLFPTDRDPLDITTRRIHALASDLRQTTNLAAFDTRLAALETAAATTPVADIAARIAHFATADRLLREIALKNPLLAPIQRLVFVGREALPPDEFNWGSHMCDQYFGFFATQRGKTRGDGLYVLDNPWTDNPVARNLLDGANATLTTGPRKGQRLAAGGYLAPDVSFDGKEILFCHTDGAPKIRVWDEQTTFHIFKVAADGTGLAQLTTGPQNDLFPCWLPNGRIAFISERRGGYGRCHGRPVPSYTLHTMHDDGDDITRLSPHETNEWWPSVDNNGMIVYTRWDYVDRGHSQAHHAWITYPDGRDARAINGNSHTRLTTAPNMEMNVRAIPGSPKYSALAAPHHGEAFGSILLIDPDKTDDGAMSQLKRVTPEQLLPEAEYTDNCSSAAYASPWPLSEKYYLCVYDGLATAQYGRIDTAARRYAITLLDVFGNKIHIYTHPQISCASPIPLAPRPKPPTLTHNTLVGRPRDPDGAKPPIIPPAELPKTAPIGLVNVYDTRFPFPPGAKVKSLRIWQVLPKTTPINRQPAIGYGAEKGAKLSLGTVPVEDDGSAYWDQPVGVPILFHALDENGCAIQGMRSATYVAPGETLMCTGCHDQRQAIKRTTLPAALRRPPSQIRPDPEGSNPFHFSRLVQPVLDAKCLTCHGANRKPKAPDLRPGDYARAKNHHYTSFNSLRPYVPYFNDPAFTAPSTTPGRFGALGSRLYPMLKKGHHGVRLTPDEMTRLTLWLDSNGLFHGHDEQILRQSRGECVPIPLQ